jgi:hypothetical protein
MDRDGDGHVDDHCPIDPLADSVAGSDFPMGDDCDDLDDRRFPGAGEFCGDGQDNDCDGLVDGDDDDCSLANDSCLSPEELQPGMVREGRTFGAVGDVATSCGDASSPDVTYRFVVPWEADVTIDVWGQESYQPLVALQRVCGDTATEVSCGADDLAVQISRLSLSAGTYFVSVESWAEGTFQILLTLEPTQGSPQGDRCAAPLALVPGERQRLDMTGFAGDVPVACARNDTFPDAVLAFTLDEPQDVRFEVESSALFGAVAVTSQCGVPGVEAACTSGFPAVGNVCALAAGSHFLVIRGHRPGLFDIGLSLSPASDTPHNNTCGGATELLPGEGVEGSLLCSSKEVDLTCDATGRHDVVYQFEIEETRDVELTLDALDDVRPALALLRGCGAEQEERWCVSNPLGPRRIEGLAPGIYHVVVSAASPSAFTLTLDLYQASVSP